MISKRGPTYWLDIWVGKHRIRRSLHTAERVIAIERARDLTAQLRAPRPAGVQIAPFVERYNEWARTTKPAYSRTERYWAKVMVDWFTREGLLTLEQVSTQSVERLRAWLLTKNVGHTTKTISRTTANRYMALLRTMFNKARDWGEFSGENPVSRVKFFREGAKVRPLTDDEVKAVLSAVDTLAKHKYSTPLQREAPALFRFILQTGLRRSEALMLRWSDFGDDSITIKGKGGKARTIPLNAEARSAIASRPRNDKYVFAIPGRESDYVLKSLHKTISAKVGFRFHVHLLRHKFASNLLERGVDIVTIGELLGHSAVLVTMLYAHTNPRLKRAAVDLLDTKRRHLPTDVKGKSGRK
jgi:integrase